MVDLLWNCFSVIGRLVEQVQARVWQSSMLQIYV